MPDWEGNPYTQEDHDEAVENGCLWLAAIVIITLAIVVMGVTS